MPLDPVELSRGESPKNVPDFIDENPNRDLIMEGMEASENELREAADDEYGVDPSLPISDEIIEDDEIIAPEIAAIHETHVDDG